MSGTDLDAQRALFEVWLRTFWPPGYEPRKTANGTYENAGGQNYWVCWQAALASQAPAVQQEPVGLTTDEDAELHNSLNLKLEQHRMLHMFDVEEGGVLGSAHCLIDRLSIDARYIGTGVSTGEEEIKAIVDAVFEDAKEYAISIISKRIHDRACMYSKCLKVFDTVPSPQGDAENTILKRLLIAAETYANGYIQDEAEERECCISDEQHEQAKELFAAIDAARKEKP